MAGKDYYKILGINQTAKEDQIKQAYRRLALQYHPDRNSGDPRAEDRFKEISEAYGVLMDRDKRRLYDSQQRTFGGAHQYRQEDIFRDMFRNPQAQDLFRELSKEFEKYGVRFDQQFMNRVFFGGRGIFFGGVFFGGPIFSGGPFSQGFGRTSAFGRKSADPTLHAERREKLSGGVFSKLSRKIETLLLGQPSKPVAGEKTLDMTYHLTLSRQEASSGSKITIAYKKGKISEKLNVTIPPHTKSGSRLRLSGKGLPNPAGGPPGDLYLHIKVTD